jgi:hypothetical protein
VCVCVCVCVSRDVDGHASMGVSRPVGEKGNYGKIPGTDVAPPLVVIHPVRSIDRAVTSRSCQ